VVREKEKGVSFGGTKEVWKENIIYEGKEGKEG